MNGAFESSSMFVLGEVALARLKIARATLWEIFLGGYAPLPLLTVKIRARGCNLVSVLTLAFTAKKREREREDEVEQRENASELKQNK